jgi:UDP-galactopyranose mutase
MDLELLHGVAEARRGWHFIMIGPVVKIDPADLPRTANIHYLGGKSYDELPGYMAGWDLAMMPFARNDSTRFISPTKTPEYLCAGLPVISTPIRDVVRPYGEQGLVHIAETPAEFIAAAEKAFAIKRVNPGWISAADMFLGATSWDITWSRMMALIDSVAAADEVETPKEIGLQPVNTMKPGFVSGD